MKKKLIIVTSIRPDFIRLAHLIRKAEKEFNLTIIHSGQHFSDNLFKIFLDDLNLPYPHYNLNLGEKYKTHHELSGMIGSELIKLIEKENLKPDGILFLGDSNAVLGTVSLRKEYGNKIKLIHVESLMRSGDFFMMEEINRSICDKVCHILFTYHEDYLVHAKNEGLTNKDIFTIGNTIVEPLREIQNKICNENSYWKNPDRKHIIVDIHRPENFKYKDRMEKIIEMCNEYSVVYNLPVKMLKFPRTMQYIKDFNIDLGKIELVELMGYIDFIKAQLESMFIVSDSGSASEECPLLERPLIVPRDYSERPQCYLNNNAYPFYLNNFEIELENSINWINNWKKENSKIEWLGDGTTSERIVNILKELL